jgi:hypothetical protein
MWKHLFREFRFRRQADYGSISVVMLNKGVTGIWVVDPLERPHANYTQSTHPYTRIYSLFTFILYNTLSLSPSPSPSLCLGNTTAGTMQVAQLLFISYQQNTHL